MITAMELIVGIALLYYGAEWLVRGGVGIATRLGIPPLVIGLTLVSFATSSPELVVSIKAAISGSGDLSLGNVVGSNICNVGLILGMSSLLSPTAVDKRLLRFDIPLLLIVSMGFALLGITIGTVGRLAGGVFVILLVFYLLHNLAIARQGATSGVANSSEVEENRNLKVPFALFLVIVGLGALILGAQLMVSGAVTIATLLGVSNAVIGLTVVAIGTSLPELATSVVAALKHQDDIAIGNVIGSNLFNLLCIMGIAPLISPVHATGLTGVDWTVMLFYTLALYPLVHCNRQIGRKSGSALLTVFVLYMTWLVISVAK